MQFIVTIFVLLTVSLSVAFASEGKKDFSAQMSGKWNGYNSRIAISKPTSTVKIIEGRRAGYAVKLTVTQTSSNTKKIVGTWDGYDIDLIIFRKSSTSTVVSGKWRGYNNNVEIVHSSPSEGDYHFTNDDLMFLFLDSN